MLNANEIENVKTTWSAVEGISDKAAELFYGKLFEIDPSLRPLFKGDMTQQGKKLMQTIGVAVAHLDRLDQVLPTVQALGRRHIGYGVRDEHYETVGTALLWTLEAGLGEAFTPEVKAAWAKTYGALAATMKAAASTAVA
jgi:hemoglobin-like flavoprotein